MKYDNIQKVSSIDTSLHHDTSLYPDTSLHHGTSLHPDTSLHPGKN